MPPVYVLLATMLLAACNGCTPNLQPRAQLDERQLVEYAVDRTVQVRVKCGGEKMGRGSGVIVRTAPGQSHVITAYHVIDGGLEDGCSLHIVNRADRWFGASLYRGDKGKDLAVLTVGVNLGVYAPIATRSYIGETVVAVGYPAIPVDRNEARLSVSRGVLATYGVLDRYTRFTAQAYYGSSGGPIFNTRGEIVGIMLALNARNQLPYEGQYFAAPHQVVAGFLE